MDIINTQKLSFQILDKKQQQNIEIKVLLDDLQNNSSIYLSDNISLIFINQTLSKATAIIEKYIEFGLQFNYHLSDDFQNDAFFLIDIPKNTVILRRDFFGKLPIYYFFDKQNKILSLSDSIKSIVTNAKVKFKANENQIISYFKPDFDTKMPDNQTFFQEIYSTLPSHFLYFKDGEAQQVHYGKLKPEKYEQATDATLIASFKKYFEKSVTSSLAFNSPIGSMLSGGLDSSSISCVSQAFSKQKINTYFIDADIITTKEKHFAHQVKDQYQTHHKDILPDDQELVAVKELIDLTFEPEKLIATNSLLLNVYKQCKIDGVAFLLSGHGGDNLVGLGKEYFSELFDKKEFVQLFSLLEFRAENPSLDAFYHNLNGKSDKQKKLFYINKNISDLLISKFKKKSLKVLISYLIALKTKTSFSFLFFLKYVLDKSINKFLQAPQIQLLSKKFSNKNEDLNNKVKFNIYKVLKDNAPLNQLRFLANSFFNGQVNVYEANYYMGKKYKFEHHYPIIDKNLLEISLATHPKLKMGNGIGRVLFREAMKDYLPKDIYNRESKAVFNLFYLNSFLQLYNEIETEIGNFDRSMFPFINFKAYENLLKVALDEKKIVTNRQIAFSELNRLFFLILWHKRVEQYLV